jgi:imidazolonepropionase
MTGRDLPRRGNDMSQLGIMPCADVLIEDGHITSVIDRSESDPELAAVEETIDAEGRVLMPAFVDCHTHACWAGCRLDEWEQKRKGASYLEILKAGGGIMSTVRAVRAASESELTELLLQRLDLILSAGTTTIEIKSGYGLTTQDELKMLRAIQAAQEDWPGHIILTACLGHAMDPDVDPDTFVKKTIGQTLPAVTAEFPGIAIDAYCEEGAWSVGQCLALFEAAAERGHPIRVHADQFHSLGMVEEAIDRQFVSIDHLEATHERSLTRLATAGPFGVMLPACGFHMDDRYADGRAFVDQGGALALATNFNPGSAPCFSLPLVIAIAVRRMGLTPAEAITATTTNGAQLLGLTDRGTIEAGQRADLVLLRHADERQLGFEFGDSPIDTVICQGELA